MTADKLIVILGLVAAIGRAYGPDVLALIMWAKTRNAKPPMLPQPPDPGYRGHP